MRGELTIPKNNNLKTSTSNFVLIDGLMIFLTSKKGDIYDFCKEELQNQIYKKLLDYPSKNIISYIKGFDSEISYEGHCGHELGHFYSKKGNLKLIKVLIEYEKSINLKKSLSMFN